MYLIKEMSGKIKHKNFNWDAEAVDTGLQVATDHDMNICKTPDRNSQNKEDAPANILHRVPLGASTRYMGPLVPVDPSEPALKGRYYDSTMGNIMNMRSTLFKTGSLFFIESRSKLSDCCRCNLGEGQSEQEWYIHRASGSRGKNIWHHS